MKQLTPKRQKAFTDWQAGLIWEAKRHRGLIAEDIAERRGKVSARQEALRSAVLDGPKEAAACLRCALALEDETIEGLPLLPRRLTAGEYLQPPVELEREIGEHWAETVTPRNASRPLFWLICHIDWLEQGLLGDDIHPALMGGGAAAGATDDVDRLEKETRNLLRRTGGLPAVRGNVSVLSDCTLSRAWWRHRLASRAAEAAESDLKFEAAHRGLHRSGPVWEELVLLGLRQLTVINHERTRAVLVAGLAERFDWPGKRLEKRLTEAARSLARDAIGRSLDQIPWRELVPDSLDGGP